MNNSTLIRFTFARPVEMAEVTQTLRLAELAVESLHGRDRTMQETGYDIDADARRLDVHTDTDLGRTLAVVFGGYARREFGEDAVRVERLAISQQEGGPR